MTIRDMAEAHMQNVQQQLGDLKAQKTKIEADIQTLSEYLQHGAEELNVEIEPKILKGGE